MKKYQYIGIFSSLLIIFFFLIIGPSMELIMISDELIPYYDIYIYFVLSIAGIGLDYALFGMIRPLKEKQITIPLLVMISLRCLLLLNNGYKYFGTGTSDYVKITLNLIVWVVFAYWLIQVFKFKKYDLKKIKIYGIALLSAYIILVLYAALNFIFEDQIIKSGRHPFEFYFRVSSVGTIAYVFILTFFIKKFQHLTKPKLH